MKKSLAIVLIVVIGVLAVYIVFREYQFAKWKSGEGARKQETAVRKTKESEALKKREEIYRRAAEKDKSAVAQLLTQLKDDSPMVRLAAARRLRNPLAA